MLTLPDIGWDAGWDDAWAELDEAVSAACEPVRVVGVDRGAVDLLGATGAARATLGGDVLDAMAQDPAAAPCAGDWGALRTWPDGRTTLEAVLPRRTAFRRAVADRASYEQVLAANADDALVVASLAVEPDLSRLERLVALAWDSGAQPVVVLTKADLVTDAALIAEDVAAAAPGVEVLVVSAVSGEGMTDLAARAAHGRTLALLGQSGVGKSTIVNALVGAEVLAVADVGVHGKGRHTTVRRELVPLPGGRAAAGHPRAAQRRARRSSRTASSWRSPTSRSSPRSAGSATARTTASRAVRWPQPWSPVSCRCAGWSRGGTCSARRPGWPAAPTCGCAPSSGAKWTAVYRSLRRDGVVRP